jgi:hypothetical protein
MSKKIKLEPVREDHYALYKRNQGCPVLKFDTTKIVQNVFNRRSGEIDIYRSAESFVKFSIASSTSIISLILSRTSTESLAHEKSVSICVIKNKRSV